MELRRNLEGNPRTNESASSARPNAGGQTLARATSPSLAPPDHLLPSVQPATRHEPSGTRPIRSVRKGATSRFPIGERAGKSHARMATHVDDEALIQAYMEASQTKAATTPQHGTVLRSLAVWLRAQADAPTLGELRASLLESGEVVQETPWIQAFRGDPAVSWTYRESIGGAFSAFLTGDVAPGPDAMDPIDEAIIMHNRALHPDNDATADAHVKHLRSLSRWLRSAPDRPTLAEVKESIRTEQERADKHPLVVEFKAATTSGPRAGIVGALKALATGQITKRPAQPPVDDEALIQAYVYASRTKLKTAKAYATYMREFARWLHEQDGAPSLRDWWANARRTSAKTKDDHWVVGFRDDEANSASARRTLVGALNALLTGGGRLRHEDDERVVRAYLDVSAMKPSTSETYAAYLRSLASWLRLQPDAPVLGELKARLIQTGEALAENDWLVKFKADPLTSDGPRRQIGGAVHALMTNGAGTTEPCHVDDEALISAYLSASRTLESTALAHGAYLRAFARWLRRQDDAPTLSALHEDLKASGRSSDHNPWVEEFWGDPETLVSHEKGIVGALDALVTGDTRTRRRIGATGE